MPISYFHSRGSGFEPTECAVGPWSTDMLHGRFFGGLAARALENEFARDGFRAARLTVDLFRPAGFDPIEVTTNLARQGRRIVVADAIVTAGDHNVASARAVFLALGIPPPGQIWQGEQWQSPDPEELPPFQPSDGREPDEVWDTRIHEGGFGSGQRSRVWTNDGGRLVDDEPLSPLVRAALSGDLASPLANGSDQGIGYINNDYTLALARYPVGEWVGLDTTTHHAFDGIALGAATLYDRSGPFATSTTTALANPILSSPAT